MATTLKFAVEHLAKACETEVCLCHQGECNRAISASNQLLSQLQGICGEVFEAIER